MYSHNREPSFISSLRYRLGAQQPGGRDPYPNYHGQSSSLLHRARLSTPGTHERNPVYDKQCPHRAVNLQNHNHGHQARHGPWNFEERYSSTPAHHSGYQYPLGLKSSQSPHLLPPNQYPQTWSSDSCHHPRTSSERRISSSSRYSSFRAPRPYGEMYTQCDQGSKSPTGYHGRELGATHVIEQPKPQRVLPYNFLSREFSRTATLRRTPTFSQSPTIHGPAGSSRATRVTGSPGIQTEKKKSTRPSQVQAHGVEQGGSSSPRLVHPSLFGQNISRTKMSRNSERDLVRYYENPRTVGLPLYPSPGGRETRSQEPTSQTPLEAVPTRAPFLPSGQRGYYQPSQQPVSNPHQYHEPRAKTPRAPPRAQTAPMQLARAKYQAPPSPPWELQLDTYKYKPENTGRRETPKPRLTDIKKRPAPWIPEGKPVRKSQGPPPVYRYNTCPPRKPLPQSTEVVAVYGPRSRFSERPNTNGKKINTKWWPRTNGTRRFSKPRGRSKEKNLAGPVGRMPKKACRRNMVRSLLPGSTARRMAKLRKQGVRGYED